MTIARMVLFLMLVQGVGMTFNFAFFKPVSGALLALTGFFSGMLLWVSCVIVLLAGERWFGGIPMLGMSVPSILTLYLALWGLFGLVAWRGHTFVPGNLRYLALGPAVAVVCAIVAVSFNRTVLSSDSFYMNDIAMFIADYDLLGGYLGARLASYGLFVPALLSSNVLVGVEYAFYLIPMASYLFVVIFVYIGYLSLRALALHHAVTLLLPLLMAGALFSSYFVIFNVFYVNANALAGMYLFLFFSLTWLGTQRSDPALVRFAALMLFAFALLRTESALFLATFVVIVATVSPANARLARPLSLVCILDLVWFALLGGLIGSGSDLLQPARILVMALVLGGAAAIAFISVFPRVWKWTRWLPIFGLVGMAAIDLAFWVIDSEIMAASLSAMVDNIYRVARWGALWTGLAAVYVAVVALGRPIPQERVFAISIAVFVMILWGLGFERGFPYRLGWGDSGNRILSHILPVAAYYVLLRAGRVTRLPAQTNGRTDMSLSSARRIEPLDMGAGTGTLR